MMLEVFTDWERGSAISGGCADNWIASDCHYRREFRPDLRMLKTIIITVIVLVIPLFFVFIFLHSHRNRKAIQREHHRLLAAELVQAFAARRSSVRTLLEALGPELADVGSTLAGLRLACEAANTAAGKREGQAEAELLPKALIAPETELEQSLKRLLPIALGSPEVRASATLGRRLDQVSEADQRVQAARRAWEASAADLGGAR